MHVSIISTLLASTVIAGVITERAPACVEGAYIIAARGSYQPPGPGSLQQVADMLEAEISNSSLVSVDYPAVINTGVGYQEPVAQGINATRNLIRDYVNACVDGKIVLLGFSQGAQVMSSLLGGGNGATALSKKLGKYIKGAALFGDPTFVVGEAVDAGNSTRNGTLARDGTSEAKLDTYSKVLRSYCSADDCYCASGGDPNNGVHRMEVAIWAEAATAFIVSVFR